MYLHIYKRNYIYFSEYVWASRGGLTGLDDHQRSSLNSFEVHKSIPIRHSSPDSLILQLKDHSFLVTCNDDNKLALSQHKSHSTDGDPALF